MAKSTKQKLDEEIRKVLKEEFDKKELDDLRNIIRYEVALIFFDLFRKKSSWVK